jgi:hypothetical protein
VVFAGTGFSTQPTRGCDADERSSCIYGNCSYMVIRAEVSPPPHHWRACCNYGQQEQNRKLNVPTDQPRLNPMMARHAQDAKVAH